MSRPTQKRLHPTTEPTQAFLPVEGVDVLHGPNQSAHGSENQSGDEAAADFELSTAVRVALGEDRRAHQP